jgi:hypothetical protein
MKMHQERKRRKGGREGGRERSTYLRGRVSIVDGLDEDEDAPREEDDEEEVPQNQDSGLVASVDLREGGREGRREGEMSVESRW